MERKSTPPAVVISIIVLGLTAFLNVVISSAGMGVWRIEHTGEIPFRHVGEILIFSVVPVVAIWDMFRGNSSGRYLAILSLLCLWALFLRQFTSVLFLPAIALQQIGPIIPVLFGIVTLLPALVLSLGFNKKIAEYFGADILA